MQSPSAYLTILFFAQPCVVSHALDSKLRLARAHELHMKETNNINKKIKEIDL
jgi:hypothetical protein